MSKDIYNFEEWKHEKENFPQFRVVIEKGGEIVLVERIRDNKKFSLGPYVYSGGGIFIIKEFVLDMKDIRFVIDGNPATNSQGENYRIQTLGRLPINSLKLNGRELSL